VDMTGSRQLAATQEQAWNALNDPAVLKRCIPGCEKFEPTGDNAYAVGSAIKIGPVAARFSGKVTLSDIQPPSGYTLAFEAQGGVAGFGKGESHVKLLPNEGGCEIHYQVHSTVGGKIAQLGQRLIDGAAKSMADDFFRRLDAELQALYPSALPVAAEGAAVAPRPASRGLPPLAWGVISALLTWVVYFLFFH